MSFNFSDKAGNTIGRDFINELEDALNSTSNDVTNVRTQLNTIVADAGNSNTEIVQARVDSNGNTYTTLKEHLDKIENSTDASFTATEADIGTVKTDITTMKINAATTSDIFTPTAKTRFVGHRGFNGGAPENTLIGFELAAKSGFWGVETDIQITSDGVWILSHDDTVDRVTNGTGTIRNMTLSQIKALTVDIGTNLSYYPNLRVPTLEEFLQTCKRVNVVPVIEIKGSGYTSAHYDELVRVIKKWGFERKSVVICFTLSYLTEVRQRSPHICVQWLTPITQANIDSLKALGNAIINPDNSTVTSSGVELAHANGLLVSTYTVNNFTTAQTLIAAGVDFITTDNLVGGGQL